MVWLGMRRLGYLEEAERLAAGVIGAVARSGLREYYDPRDGTGLGAKEFAWSALICELIDPEPDPEVVRPLAAVDLRSGPRPSVVPRSGYRPLDRPHSGGRTKGRPRRADRRGRTTAVDTRTGPSPTYRFKESPDKDAGKRAEGSALQCVTRGERPRTPSGAYL